MKATYRGLSVSMFALVAAGCTTPNPTPMNRPGDVPPAYTAPVADKQAPVWPEANWWVNFKADELPALMDTAQKENLDLAAAAARVIEAEAEDGEAFAGILPVVNAQGSATRTGTHSSLTGTPITSNTFSAGLAASYQADFWGEFRDKLYQARENLRAARYAETVVGITTESSVAQQYFTVLAARERIVIARQNIDAAKRILTVVQAKVTNGVSSNLDLAQEQAVVAPRNRAFPD